MIGFPEPVIRPTQKRPKWEVADVIHQYGEAFLNKHGGHLTATQKKALRDLGRCRTAALGGHVDECLDCGLWQISYNSCRNRHCPQCQALTRARWLDQQAEHLLPVDYYHVVFTLPRAVVLRNMVLNHNVHHRGQMTVYLRLLDVPVPGLYGPSADEA